jgi:hypothetical protein
VNPANQASGFVLPFGGTQRVPLGREWRYINMRIALIAILVIGCVGACALPKLGQPTSSVIKTCETGYSPSEPGSV